MISGRNHILLSAAMHH